MEKKRKRKKNDRKKRKSQIDHQQIAPLFGNVPDYGSWRMSTGERMLGGMLGFLVGLFVGMIFFRNLLISVVAGCCLVFPAQKVYCDYLKSRRSRNLLLQFRDMMESLSGSFSAGQNATDAFQSALADMTNLYGEKADITREMYCIVGGIFNGQQLVDLLINFGKRSHLEDIENFATIFNVAVEDGADMRKVVADTRTMIVEKIETEMEIQTLLAGNKNELNIMILMPLLIMVMLSGMGNMSVVQNTPANVLVKCGVLVLFILAYAWGRKIVDIRV